ncbi:zinc-dependent peptidase [Hymenobacter nivis]|uniref:Peptidase n=1 Tax=Hymenobacter nivis TaxID=1850093 RepID=A0A2Z3GN44_9BACT|nr:zinc-dependent peptidase [Hymenobacter nivis]AWM32636.1 peptidase [Hymenobacter nivis]
MSYFLSLAVLAAVVFGFYRYATADGRRRAAALAVGFPAAWGVLLAENVAFYQALGDAEKSRFEQRVQLFLADTHITGVQTEVDELTRLLVAAAAVIPTFGFPEWTYAHLGEVLVVPDAWVLGPDSTQEVQPLQGTLLGSVQRFQNQHYMRLSKASLLQGFANPQDRQNVGIHEFAHLLDEADGVIDGVPQVALPARLLGPWAAVVHREMEALRAGKSEINPYAGTNEAEFFAVVTEYFFEKPDQLQAHHPELYALLTELFHQRPGAHQGPSAGPRRWLHQLRGPGKFSRNSPCPCGSGKPYKNCHGPAAA